jgi:CMD domain protein
MTSNDLVDAAAGLSPESPVARLRRQREAFVRHTQGSHDVLITPADPAGLSLIERAAVALRVASIEHDAALIEHYRSRLRQIVADAATIEAAEASAGLLDVSPRLAAILDHVALVATSPGSASQSRLDALRNAGLAPRDIVTIAQIVAFVSYQVRVVAGLRALAQGAHP